MNKMLEVLKQLQDESGAALTSGTKSGTTVRRVTAEETPPQAKKFDVSSWNLQGRDQSGKSETSLVAQPGVLQAEPLAPVSQVPVVQRFESPWERCARTELADPLQARTYRAVLDRWRDDLPGNHPRAVMIVGIGCEESDVAEFALRIGMLQATTGTSTLLVDAEPSRWLSNVLVAYDQPGLVESYMEEVPAKHFLQVTHTDGLKLLPGGLRSVQAAPNSVAVARLLNDLKAQATWTIITAGDGNSVWTADFARASDAVYLLVRLGAATSVGATQVRQQLHNAGARLLGCIALAEKQD